MIQGPKLALSCAQIANEDARIVIQGPWCCQELAAVCLEVLSMSAKARPS